MKNFLSSLFTICFLFNGSSIVHAEIELWDWGINIDGTSYCLEGPCDFDFFSGGQLTSLADLPSSIDYTTFNLSDDSNVRDGLGILTITVTGAGSHSVSVYLNYDLDYVSNDKFNETGEISGTPETGLSWEIDEIGWGELGSPGTAGEPYIGDIFYNFVDSGTSQPPASWLDNQIFFTKLPFPDGQSLDPPIEDTALAKSWDFNLVDGETAVITFIADTVEPADFYIVQKDTESDTNVYLSSSINQESANKPFPWIMFLPNIVRGIGQ